MSPISSMHSLAFWMTVFDECQFVNQQNMTNISMVAQKSIKKENACMRDFASATLTQNIITLYSQWDFSFAWPYFRHFPNVTLGNTSTTQTELDVWNCWFVQKKLKAFLNGDLLTVTLHTFNMIEAILCEFTWAANFAEPPPPKNG